MMPVAKSIGKSDRLTRRLKACPAGDSEVIGGVAFWVSEGWFMGLRIKCLSVNGAVGKCGIDEPGARDCDTTYTKS